MVFGLGVGVAFGIAFLILVGISPNRALAILASDFADAFAAAPRVPPALVDHREWLLLPCAGQAMPAISRPFDPAALHVEATTTPEAQMVELLAMLRDAAATFRREPRHIDSGQDLARALALFPWRFGLDARRQAGWQALADEARRVLEDVEADPARLPLDGRDSYAELFRVQLLQLAGRDDEAAERLARLEVRHMCGNCAAERTAVVNRRRSEAAERRGDVAEALALLESTVASPFGMGSRLGHDSDAARLGLLLLLAGRDTDGACVLQQAVDLFPGSPGAEVARAALGQLGALREPTPERLKVIYLDGLPEHDFRRRMAQQAMPALPDTRGAFEILCDDARAGDLVALRSLAALRDPRARPLLQETLSTADRVNLVWEAALGLHALGDGQAPLEAALRRLADEQDLGGWMAAGELDEGLRRLLGDGPATVATDRAAVAAMARAWLAWLAPEPAR